MQTQNTQISCPQCDHQIDVNNVLRQKLDSDLRKEYEEKLNEERNNLKSQQNQLEKSQRELQTQQAAVKDQIDRGIQIQLKVEQVRIEQAERQKAQKETQASTALLQQELKEKTDEVKELHQARAEISRLKRDSENIKAKLEAENEQKLNEKIAEEKISIQQAEASKSELKIREKEELINTLNKQLTDAQRRAEQGSMQSQGEAQELAVEEWLMSQFPHDNVEEIKKGARGGDCIQTINTVGKEGCGSIYYESKRTKAFKQEWIEKFKTDMRARNTDIGVIVSQARPTGINRMGMVDGVWVCNFDEFKGLCQVLRNQIIQIDQVRVSQENKGDKMAMLYEFLQSNEFRLQVEAIVEGFTQMKADLDKEKRSIQGHWKKREKQIDKVLLNTGDMYNCFKGIAGSSVQSVAALEFEDQS